MSPSRKVNGAERYCPFAAETRPQPWSCPGLQFHVPGLTIGGDPIAFLPGFAGDRHAMGLGLGLAVEVEVDAQIRARRGVLGAGEEAQEGYSRAPLP